MAEHEHNTAGLPVDDRIAAESAAWFERHHRPLLFACVFVAIVTALAGQRLNIPLESHEVFVARSAEEMIARRDWLVPWLNDEPRLKKPPMSYWLVIAVDRLSGTDGDVREWEARAPSAVAAVLLVIVTLLIGRELFDPRTGVATALMLAASSGYMTYSHSARPEMVYALCCAAGLLAFIHADRCWHNDDSRTRAKWYAWLGWAAFAVGMLTKGPQLQFVMLVGYIVALLAQRRPRDILPVLRPFTGLAVFALLSLWWYAAVYFARPDAMDVWNNQLVNRIADRDKPLGRYFNPYYVYRTAGLLLPWVVFYIFALLAPWTRELRRRPATSLLWWLMVTAMVLLWLPLVRRWYYMLPIVPAIAVLMGAFAVRWADQFYRDGRVWIWRNTLLGHVIAFLAAAVYLLVSREERPPLPWWSAAAIFTACALGIVACIRVRSDDRATADRALLVTVLTSAVLLAGAAVNGTLWSDRRSDVRDSTARIAEHVAPTDPLYGWRSRWVSEVYYLDRTIPTLINLKDLHAEAKRYGVIWVMVDDDNELDLPGDLTGRRVFDAEYTRGGGKQLWRIAASQP